MKGRQKMANVKRLIDAVALLSEIGRIIGGCSSQKSAFHNVLLAIHNAPTVDAVEVVHGRWETNCDPEECEKDFYCSVCEELICDFDTTALYPGENCYYYCPNCGAKMDRERNN